MKYDFLTIGGATLDVSFFIDKGFLIDNRQDLLRQKLLAFEYGAKIRIDKFHRFFGGGASNTAVNLAGLGFKTGSLIDIGDDENGRAIIKNLKDNGVNVSLLTIHKDTDSGSSFILIGKDSERVIFTTRGANDQLVIDSARLKALRQTSNIYIASLSGPWIKDLTNIFSKTNAHIFWNPGASQLEGGLKKITPFLKKTFCLMLNKDEALELVLGDPKYKKEGPKFFNSLENICLVMKSYGPQLVLITDGENGAMAYDGINFNFQKIIKEQKKLDLTGVGDIYNSTFAAGLLLCGGDIKKALGLASLNAASKISHMGAQNGLLSKKQLIK